MSEIAELKGRIDIAKIKVSEAEYEANLDLVKRRKDELARLEADMEKLAGPKPNVLAELAAASTEAEIEAVLQWAIDGGHLRDIGLAELKALVSDAEFASESAHAADAESAPPRQLDLVGSSHACSDPARARPARSEEPTRRSL
jgi:hypothetical protein